MRSRAVCLAAATGLLASALPHSVLSCFQESLAIVAKESFKVYKAISEGLINLADRFFEMST